MMRKTMLRRCAVPVAWQEGGLRPGRYPSAADVIYRNPTGIMARTRIFHLLRLREQERIDFAQLQNILRQNHLAIQHTVDCQTSKTPIPSAQTCNIQNAVHAACNSSTLVMDDATSNLKLHDHRARTKESNDKAANIDASVEENIDYVPLKDIKSHTVDQLTDALEQESYGRRDNTTEFRDSVTVKISHTWSSGVAGIGRSYNPHRDSKVAVSLVVPDAANSKINLVALGKLINYSGCAAADKEPISFTISYFAFLRQNIREVWHILRALATTAPLLDNLDTDMFCDHRKSDHKSHKNNPFRWIPRPRLSFPESWLSNPPSHKDC